MIRLAANLSTLFTELPFLQRFGAAAAAGFVAVECQFPYEAEPQAIAGELHRLGLEWVLFNAPFGNAGERGIASLPGRERDFDAGIELAARYAAAGNCRRVHVMAGLLPRGGDRARHLDTYVAAIGRAADRLAAVGATVMIEPINTRMDVPGYLLDSTALAEQCIARAARPNIRLQYDIYHMQVMQGDLLRSIQRLLPLIGHIQVADNPGRHEPGSGEIAFERLLPAIDALGYQGYIGCEYLPAAGTMAGLVWAQQWLGEKSCMS
ncbi:MAG TPA: TIM barrel protein [Steroidobacteraceae bacterium]|nr:TIM barrel protein [Steroidobacteraceae bacterium]